jgi:hypothetical protein
MDAPIQFYQYWYFHIPNYVLAALMYSLLVLIARFAFFAGFAAAGLAPTVSG